MSEQTHTHDEPKTYMPPAEQQVEMLFQENSNLTNINLRLRMQITFQAQMVEQLTKQLAGDYEQPESLLESQNGEVINGSG